MRILIVGNVIKDVYLSFDEKDTPFEMDENNVPWVDIPFDGSHHDFFRRTSVFAGAAVTAEIFNNLGLDATVSGHKLSFSSLDSSDASSIHNDGNPCDVYRYILCYGNNISYLVPSERAESIFEAPTEPVDWIFVDRSAELTKQLVDSIENYLSISRVTRLASFISTKGCTNNAHIDMRTDQTYIDDATRKLAMLSNLIFSDGDLFDLQPQAVICKITDHSIEIANERVHYHVNNDDTLTHLTIYSIIAATVFGAIITGAGAKNSLRIAAINAENAKVTGTLKLKDLKEKLMESQENQNNLSMIAKTMVAHGKGILAADESGGSIHKKFLAAGIPDDEEHRRDYRNIFFTTRDLEKYVNGVILFDETARQKADNGENFTTYLTNKGIIPGIKVDQGLEPFDDQEHANETWTKGLDGLPERLVDYYNMGLRFAKWRAAFEVRIEQGEIKTPTEFAIRENAKILAQYALDCQNAGIVPIVEPEVVHDGDYSIDVCKKLTGMILDALFEELNNLGVDLTGCVLKCNMVLAGGKFARQSTPEEVGYATAEVLKAHVPEQLAGVVFLSGGQTVEQATDNLQEVTNNGPFPWPVTFSYARALQGPALDAWKGDNNNADAARDAFYARLVANCNALDKNR